LHRWEVIVWCDSPQQHEKSIISRVRLNKSMNLSRSCPMVPCPLQYGMEIQDYAFGRIVIGGETYTKDVIVFHTRVFSPWWRAEGHGLSPEDLVEVFKEPVRLIIIGTGASGVMQVPGRTTAFLKGKGLDVEVMKTPEAVSRYNQLLSEGRTDIVAALHLTC
jgi:hypothetical protein